MSHNKWLKILGFDERNFSYTCQCMNAPFLCKMEHQCRLSKIVKGYFKEKTITLLQCPS